MKMTDHQKRLWQSMINQIQNYLDGKTKDFYTLVGELEGALDASGIIDNELINKWYNFWTPLEIRRSIQGNNINKKEAIHELKNMKNFLLQCREITKK